MSVQKRKASKLWHIALIGSRLTLFHPGAEDGSWGPHAIRPLEIITKGIKKILLANLFGRQRRYGPLF